jgi:hypothetical protein
MLAIILIFTLSLNVFHCLNPCELFNTCMSYVKCALQIGIRAIKPW